MSQFFIKGRNRGNERRVILRSATLLVGKAPTKQKRVKLKLSMPLNGPKVVGIPDWVTEGMEYVAKSHGIAEPEVEFSGMSVEFSDDNLFEKGISSVKCQMRGFTIHESGDRENPDVDMDFALYAPFSSALWKWCGQMGGEEFWGKFEQIVEEESEDLELTGEEEEEEKEVEA